MWLVSSSENGIIKSDKVYEVMLATDRGHFSKCNPYMDSPQSIGEYAVHSWNTQSTVYETMTHASLELKVYIQFVFLFSILKAIKLPSALHTW